MTNNKCREISYTALKNGGGCVRVLNNDDETMSGFDLESYEGEIKEYIGVKTTDETGAFTISNAELQAMNNSNDKTNYVIHSYYIVDGKIQAFNIYKYDKNKKLLVDMIDKKKACTLESRILNNDGTSIVIYDCIPTKVKMNI